MHEDSNIDSRIDAILAGSGLPLERRMEVADELRCHLEELISAKKNAGLSGEQAVETALADFGPPVLIRRQLKKQQRILDRRSAFPEFRRAMLLLATLCSVFAMLFSILAPGSAGFGSRFLCGAYLFVTMVLIMSVPIYLAALISLQVKRQRPKAEYSFAKSFMRYAVIVLFYLYFTLAMGPFVVGFIGYIGQYSLFQSIIYMAPEVLEGAPWLIWHNIGIVAWESPIRSFVMPALMVIVSALVIALYERSRCVEMETFSVLG